MPLPACGPLSLSQIQTEFGGSNPISLSEYYAGGGLVPAGTTGTYGAVPSSGTISIRNFYGTSNLIRGCAVYTTAGTYTWVAPSAVASVSVVAIGGGGGGSYGATGGGGGGGLGYINNYSVTTGTGYTVVVGFGGGVGNSGTASYFASSAVVRGGAGSPNAGAGGSYTGAGGGNGGNGAVFGGGGGAGGYSGNGGNGGGPGYFAGSAGAAGSGAGGGGAGGDVYCTFSGNSIAAGGGGGGGVGLYGRGSTGAGGTPRPLNSGGGGGGGSGGGNGLASCGGISGGDGGLYGGGGGSGGEAFIVSSCTYICGCGGNGARGAVRIVYPGATRTFPTTDVA